MNFASLAIDVDLALSDAHPPVITAQKPSQLHIRGIRSLFIIDVGQTGQNGRESETLSVTAEEGDVHECIADGYGL